MMASLDFITPGANAVLLTDELRTVGVFATARSPFGAMLSRQATELLVKQWFQGKNQEMDCVGKMGGASDEEVEEFVRSLHPGLCLTAKAPQTGPAETRRLEGSETLTLEGLRPFRAGAGRLSTRKIGHAMVTFHEAERPLERGYVPDLPGVFALDASIGMLPQKLQIQRAQLAAGSNCAGCAGCAACAGCVFCAEVNFFVGAVGFAGLVGLVGLSGSFTIGQGNDPY
jgi:hypothetical protein